MQNVGLARQSHNIVDLQAAYTPRMIILFFSLNDLAVKMAQVNTAETYLALRMQRELLLMHLTYAQPTQQMNEVECWLHHAKIR